ncbi:MAG: hypothetical protein AB7S78_06215 [Candidatus Omnitrophota bacterium]
MKKLIVLLSAFLLFASSAQAFLYSIKILTKAEIKQLTDEDLASIYLEAKIEEKASAEFHEGAGFSNAKEYDKRKELLRFIVYLRQEMSARGIEPDPVDLWLK